MFWGLIMDSGKRYTQTVERAFHVSMACLEPNSADNENVSVMLAFDNREFILCNLNKHKAVQSPLDLNFQSGDRIAFMSSGKGRVHLTGYLLETDEDDEDDDDMSGDELNESSMNVSSDSPKESNSIKGTNKRKNEPAVTKPESKKVKLEAKSSSDEDEDEDEEEEDDSILSTDDDLLLDGTNEEDDDDDDDEDDDISDEDLEDDSDEVVPELETKSKANKKKKDKQKSPIESPQSKNKSPVDKQKMKSLMEKQQQQKNKTPNEKQQQQQKHKTPNEKQKTPGSQMNGMPQQQQQSGKKNKKGMDTPKGAKSPGGGTPGGVTPVKKVLEGGVTVEDIKVGNGPVAKPGRQVSVYYVGRLKNNNKQFDSATEGSGFKFRLGRGEVIKGWDIGLSGMKVGGKRKVICPAALAYGNKGSPPTIPPNSTLVFDVELKGVN